MVPELDTQLDPDEAELLRTVLAALADGADAALGGNLHGVYLKGSFALGSGDVHADADFLVVVEQPLDAEQETEVRELHRGLPERPEHWAHVLEGSYAPLDELRARPDPTKPWLYVDNGQREMEMSTHDDTEVFRWVLRNRALTIAGPVAGNLIDAVPTQALRDEASAQAVRRQSEAGADPAYLSNAWGQPHEVLTHCRMLFTATTGEVAAKEASARWCLEVLPEQWHGLIRAAIQDRPDPWGRVHRAADPELTKLTRMFIDDMTPRIRRAAAGRP